MHVEALNLIDLEFPAQNKRFKTVRSAWKAYHAHLFERMPEDSQLQAVFFSKRQDLFEDMLYEMGLSLGYDFDKTQIGKDAYSPLHQEQIEADALTIRTKLVELLPGRSSLPLNVVQFPTDPEFIEAQVDYLKAIVDHISAGKPWPVTIVASDAGRIVPVATNEQMGESQSRPVG